MLCSNFILALSLLSRGENCVVSDELKSFYSTVTESERSRNLILVYTAQSLTYYMEENFEEKICFLRKEVYISLAASTGSAYCSVLCTTDICHWHVGHSWILERVSDSLPAATLGQVSVLDKIELGFDLPTQPARSRWAGVWWLRSTPTASPEFSIWQHWQKMSSRSSPWCNPFN